MQVQSEGHIRTENIGKQCQCVITWSMICWYPLHMHTYSSYRLLALRQNIQASIAAIIFSP